MELVLEVNVEIAFLVNFLTDLAWLWAAASLAGISVRPGRMTAAGALGAALAVWAYFPTGRWLASGPGVVLGTAGLLAIAFWPYPRQHAVRVVAYFLLSGGAMAGAVMLASSRSTSPAGITGASGADFPASLVASGVVLCLVGARYLWRVARQRSRLSSGLYSLRIRMGERTVELPALLDTGNALREPLSGAPVGVVEAAALEGFLPPLVVGAAAAGWEALDRLPQSWVARCRLVPFRAVGQPVGILLAVLPDELSVLAPGAREWLRVQGLVGLAGERLHPEGTYRALLPPAMVAEAGEDPAIAWEGETG